MWNTMKITFTSVLLAGIFLACAAGTEQNQDTREKTMVNNQQEEGNFEKATFGAGCFWCVEAVFQRLEGVKNVKPGYSGGDVKNPSYREVCTGRTGHAEVIQLEYNPEVITFDELLEVFWTTHDPTTLNQQGNDLGTQYRSAVFYHNEEQKNTAEAYKKKLNAEEIFDKPIVTEITAFDTFYVAEEDHFNYYNENSSQPYCSFVITPKIEKLEKVFKDKLKK